MDERIDLAWIFRDRHLLDYVREEITTEALAGWRPWEVYLPPEVLWPMAEEINQGRVASWSPCLLGVPVQVGVPNEIKMRFVLEGMKTSPVKVTRLNYYPTKTGYTVPVEVNGGPPV